MANNPIGDKRTFRRILKLTAAMEGEEEEVDKRSQYLTFVDSRTATCVGVRTAISPHLICCARLKRKQEKRKFDLQ